MRHLPSALTITAVLIAIAAVPSSAAAQGAPTMPLSSVVPGMRCTADTVIKGTDIVPFDLEVVDIVTDGAPDDARILVRASGPNVDATGIAQGFSGSPMWCPTAEGGRAIAGAVSAGVGDYGNLVGLVTPIAAVLGTPVDVPSTARRDAALLRSARPLTSPLTISGFSAPVATALRQAGARVGQTVISAPAGARALMPPQTLRPGSSVSALYASGDFGVGAVGTVTYTDGDSVWAFGHPLDGAGRRAIALGDAYVYTVVDNPIGSEPLVSYKLASPVNTLGTLTYDGPNAIAGTIARKPTMIPLSVKARDADTGRTISLDEQVADERALGNPTGVSLLGALAPSITAQASYEAFQGNPSQQSGDMCMAIALAERKQPIRLCNHYVGAYAGATGVAMSPIAGDVSRALSLLDGYQFGYPVISSVKVSMTLRRDRGEGTLVSATPLGPVRLGKDVRVRLAYRVLGSGKKGTRTVRVHVPADTGRGNRYVTFTGTEADVPMNATSSAADDSVVFDLSSIFSDTGADPKPQKLEEIITDIEALHRTRGVAVSFDKRLAPAQPTSDADIAAQQAAEAAMAASAQRVLTGEKLLISGKASFRTKVR